MLRVGIVGRQRAVALEGAIQRPHPVVPILRPRGRAWHDDNEAAALPCPAYDDHFRHGVVGADGTLRPPGDRVALIFHAFVKSANNGARWVGENDKLTRLKFEGGLTRVLRLKMAWPQVNTPYHRDLRLPFSVIGRA